jgi:hypothetical protein
MCPNCIWLTNSIRKMLCFLTCKNDYTITGLTPRPTPAFRTYVDGGTLYDTSDSTHPTTASQLTSVAPRELSVSEARAEGSTTVAMTRKVSLLRAAASTPDAPAGEPRLVLAQDQGCESRRQTFSSITGPTFREIWKVWALPRSLTLLGKKVSPGLGPLFGFSRPNPAGNEIPIANR